jgi:hypothetical protein
MADEVKNPTGTVEVEEEQPHQETFVKTENRSLSSEEELRHLVSGGDLDLVRKHPAYLKRNAESQLHIAIETIDNRLKQTEKATSILMNGGSEDYPAAVGSINRAKDLRWVKKELPKRFYRQHARSLDKKAGVKIDFNS